MWAREMQIVVGYVVQLLTKVILRVHLLYWWCGIGKVHAFSSLCSSAHLGSACKSLLAS